MDKMKALVPKIFRKIKYLHQWSVYSSLLVIALCSGCASNPVPFIEKKSDFNGESARLRFFGNNGFGLVFFRNADCIPEDSKTGTRVSGDIGQSFSALVGMDQTESIGMPASERSSRPRNGILAREFYKEYRVAAGERISFVMSYVSDPLPVVPKGSIASGGIASCTIPGGTLVPATGKDYDVFLDVRRGARTCLASVRQIEANGVSIPVPVQAVRSCD